MRCLKYWNVQESSRFGNVFNGRTIISLYVRLKNRIIVETIIEYAKKKCPDFYRNWSIFLKLLIDSQVDKKSYVRFVDNRVVFFQISWKPCSKFPFKIFPIKFLYLYLCWLIDSTNLGFKLLMCVQRHLAMKRKNSLVSILFWQL